MKKSIIAMVVASVVLTGCGPSDAELAAQKAADQKAWLEQFQAQQAQEEADLNKQLAEKKNAEDAELAGIVAELKKGDPAIKDAYYGFNDKGERTLHVVRDESKDQPQQAQQGYQQGANGQPVIINNQPAQAASSGVSETVWPLLAGAGAGMLLANAMNSSGGFSNYSQNHRPYSNNYYNDSDYRRERTRVVNNYRTVVVKETRDTYRQSPTYQQKYPKQYQGYQQQKAIKPNTGSSINQSSSWASKPKPQPTAPKVTSNSGWGSSTPSRSSFSQPTQSKPKVSSNSGWGSSSSSTSSKPKVSSNSGWGSSSSVSKPSSSVSRSSSFSSSRSSSPSRSSFSSSRRR